MKLLSLFSGVGGFDLGLERAGFETVFQCEWDKNCQQILKRQWPNVPKWDDVSTLTGKYILEHAPVIDVVAWGSPCQDLSVAGKRAGLTGERSGLFHQGIRIIKELRELTNGKYPRISIWENVAGALSSNNGADFGEILYEMDEAGACFSEWRVLDAQFFGIPQRRRRVFVVSVFDPATAAKCSETLLPVSEGLRWDFTESAKTRESITRETSQSLGSGGDIANTISASLYHHGTVVNQDANNGHVVVEENTESFTPSSFAQYEKGVGTLRSNGGDLGGGSETILTFTKSRRAQSATDDETWVEGQPAPTLNAFDQGDVRATTVIAFASNQRAEVRDLDDKAVALAAEPGTNQQTYLAIEETNEPMIIDGTRVDDVRVYESPVQTLKERMGTGGNNVPVVAFSHTQGLDAQPSEKAWPTLRKEGNGHAVAFGIQGNVIGRQDHNGPAGKGHTDEGDPMFTLNTTDIHAVVYSIQDGREIEKNQNGLGISEEGAPAYTLDQTGAQAVAYDEYNNTINNVHQSLRAGTPQSTGVLVEQPAIFEPGAIGRLDGPRYSTTVSHTLRAEMGDNLPAVLLSVEDNEVVGTLRSGGDGGVPSSRGEHLVVESNTAAGFKPGASSKSHSIGYEEELSPTLEGGGGGNNKPAIVAPTLLAGMSHLTGTTQDGYVKAINEASTTMVVRRLTPLECERLMGWPDNHTLFKADGTEQADTHRYKQCGNGVASPVAHWIGEQIVNL